MNNVAHLVAVLKAETDKLEKVNTEDTIAVKDQVKPVTKTQVKTKTLVEAIKTNQYLFFKGGFNATPCLEIRYSGESEKAVKFNVKGYDLWLPKSALTIENGVHLVVKPWFKFSGFGAELFKKYSFIAG